MLNKADTKASSNYYGEYRTTQDPVLNGTRKPGKSRAATHARRSTWPGEKSSAGQRR